MKPFIQLSHVDISFPVFDAQSIGLINTLVRFTGMPRSRSSTPAPIRTVHALHDINLELRSGDRIGLIGHNGAGKSTLLRVLSGVYEPVRGHIRQHGSVSALTDIMLGIDAEASGMDFIITRGIVMGLSKREACNLIDEIGAFTELTDRLHMPVRTYSAGMLLKLAFAVATTVTPDILLMDEVVGAGDAKFQERAQKRLHDLMSRVSILVVASHNEQLLKSFCSHALVLSHGQIAHRGKVDECLAYYHANG
ncbi:ABC transporter ATP-binding protein [Diaphorobacter caeni]|uniref:ABC transporter ATP-binding protein n=1 Tax=Diaphorobacter caeni TaxID=2784387 RepID=UPI00188F588C|nr:ABC transporter ATP-binding protein [Diaphorobacter caeni]MBF5003502.1 ABC transporter ATP-binding protein [Diaphorobacter caeni]